jgi:hypothetical protein
MRKEDFLLNEYFRKNENLMGNYTELGIKTGYVVRFLTQQFFIRGSVC